MPGPSSAKTISPFSTSKEQKKTHAKNNILIASANPTCANTTATTIPLLVLLSTTLTTGHRFRTRKPALTTKPTPTNTQFSTVIGLQLISATGIQIMFPYPYSAQHSTRLMPSPVAPAALLDAPYHRSNPHSTTGIKRVYP